MPTHRSNPSSRPPPPAEAPLNEGSHGSNGATASARALPVLVAREPPSQRRPRSRTIEDRDFRREAFSPGQRLVIRALAEALFSEATPEGRVAPARPELCDRVTGGLEGMVGSGSTDLRRGFRVLSWLIEWLPFLVVGAFVRASRMSVERRLSYLEALECSRIGLFAALLVAFKIPMSMIAYELEPELRLSGFDRLHTFTRRKLRDEESA